ncbi:MAG: 50S ribosomal protein L4 [Planctomycetota bacterium]
MMDIPVHDHSGNVVETIQFDDSCLGRTVHKTLMHEAIVAYEANKRVGTACTKTRREVVGAGTKPWRQKGTGRARVGTKRNPVWRGGGIVFGPKPRDYSKKMPKKARKLALKSALLAKIRDGQIKVVSDFKMETPKTKEAYTILKTLGVDSNSLVVLKQHDANTWKSVRNIEKVDMAVLKEMNAYNALLRGNILFTKDAFTAIPEEIK